MRVRWISLRNGVLLFVAGGAVSFCAGLAGAVGVGPFIRWAVGQPFEYGSDYSSPEAVWHAIGVLVSTLLAAFFAAGWVATKWSRPPSWRAAMCAANPASLGLAFVALLLLLDGARVADGYVTNEYIGPTMMALQMFLALPIYAPAIRLGARAARSS